MASPTPGRHEHPWGLSGRDLHRILSAGLARLEVDIDEINRLNVFPVPDQDTGSNMFDTLRYTLSGPEPGDREPVGAVAAEMADLALFGARGTSGLILAEFLRGFARELFDEERIDTEAAGFVAVIKGMALGAGDGASAPSVTSDLRAASPAGRENAAKERRTVTPVDNRTDRRVDEVAEAVRHAVGRVELHFG